MNPGVLQTQQFGAISVSTRQWEGRIFLESKEVNALLDHISDGGMAPRFSSSTFLKGVITPGKGAIFEVFDQFGSVVKEPVEISAEKVQEKILDRMIWQVE